MRDLACARNLRSRDRRPPRTSGQGFRDSYTRSIFEPKPAPCLLLGGHKPVDHRPLGEVTALTAMLNDLISELRVVAEFESILPQDWHTDCLDKCDLIKVVKSPLVTVSPLIAVSILNGCETGQEQRPTYDPETQVVVNKTEYAHLQNSKAGRFQTFKNATGIALDTSTGQVCRTHDWHEDLSVPLCPKNGAITGNCVMERSPYGDAPLCSTLP